MKKILLKIEDDVYNNFKSEIGIKKICGNLFGIPDQFNCLIIQAIEKGRKEIHIYKEKKKEKIK